MNNMNEQSFAEYIKENLPRESLYKTTTRLSNTLSYKPNRNTEETTELYNNLVECIDSVCFTNDRLLVTHNDDLLIIQRLDPEPEEDNSQNHKSIRSACASVIETFMSNKNFKLKEEQRDAFIAIINEFAFEDTQTCLNKCELIHDILLNDFLI